MPERPRLSLEVKGSRADQERRQMRTWKRARLDQWFREGAKEGNPKSVARWKFWAPEHVETAWEAKQFLFWIPTRRDIRKMIEVLDAVHGTESSPIRVLDIGGASGFLGKLIVDEARSRGLEVECIILDPAKDVVDEARNYYQQKGEKQLAFVTGTLADHPGLAREKFDVVLNSYMWGDLRPDIEQIRSSARIYVADRGGSTGGEDSYDPSDGFSNFGSWMVRDHGSVETYKQADIVHPWSPTSVLIQLSDDTVTRVGNDLEQRLVFLDSQPTTSHDQYVWEIDIERVNDEFLSAPFFLMPGTSKREEKMKRRFWEEEKTRLSRERNKMWWKFHRGADWLSGRGG